MFGVRSRPPYSQNGSAFILLDNGWTEAMAMAGWLVPLVIGGALLLITGRVVHGWTQPLRGQIITVAAIPISVSAFGIVMHMARAGIALSVADRLSSGRRSPSRYDRVVAWLTTPTPWLLVPQFVLGAAFAIAIALQFAFSE